jgi:carbamate kinase
MTLASPRRIVVLGAAGRDFHNFNVVYRDDPSSVVVAFTATQIPGIAQRRYPGSLAGPRYLHGIPIEDEADLEDICRRERVTLVVFAYSDVPHAHVMTLASRALALGADFTLLGPQATMLAAAVPVVAVSAVRTGCGKSPIARWLAARLRAAGRRVAVVRHPMPYSDLERQRVQRFATRADLDDAGCSIEERVDLDVLVAQTQGELGYLLCEALDAALGEPASVAIVTRVLVDTTDPAFASETKPIGRVLPRAAADGPAVRTPDGRGWRRVVASPRPRAVLELGAIRTALGEHHVVAGGGGGVPLARATDTRAACGAVVDKDRVAALLAIALGAERLIFVTDVPAAFDDFGSPVPRPIARLSVPAARARLAAGVFAAGSMGPKVESATDFVEATGHPAVITGRDGIRTALAGEAGTTIVHAERVTPPASNGAWPMTSRREDSRGA